MSQRGDAETRRRGGRRAIKGLLATFKVSSRVKSVVKYIFHEHSPLRPLNNRQDTEDAKKDKVMNLDESKTWRSWRLGGYSILWVIQSSPLCLRVLCVLCGLILQGFNHGTDTD